MPCVYDCDGVKIYLQFPDHAPPHVHVHARGYEASIVIETGALLAGKLRKNDLRYAQRVIAKNKAKLLQGFNDAVNYKSPERID